MLIGEIAGGVVSLQAPSRRTPSSALGLREDGWVALIDTLAQPSSRVRWAWTGISGRPAAVAAGWMTSEVPALLTVGGDVVTLDRSKCRRDGMVVLGEEACGRRAGPVLESLGMVTRQQCQASGPPFIITVDDAGAYWWSASQDLQPMFDGFFPWPNDAARVVRGPGVVLPWTNSRGFVKLVSSGERSAVFLVTREGSNPVLQVTNLGAVAIGGWSEYRVTGSLPVPGNVGVDFCLACPDRLLLVRLRPGREIETVEVLRAEPGRVITSADLREGCGLASTTGQRGGTVDVFDPRDGRRLRPFDLDLGVSDVLVTGDGDRTCALAVDTDGGVHLWTVRRDDRFQGSTPLPEQRPGASARRGLELD